MWVDRWPQLDGSLQKQKHLRSRVSSVERGVRYPIQGIVTHETCMLWYNTSSMYVKVGVRSWVCPGKFWNWSFSVNHLPRAKDGVSRIWLTQIQACKNRRAANLPNMVIETARHLRKWSLYKRWPRPKLKYQNIGTFSEVYAHSCCITKIPRTLSRKKCLK